MQFLSQKGWAIETNLGVIFTDKNGKWWWGGSDVGIAIFTNRWEARRLAKKIKKSSKRKSEIRWTKTVPVFSMEW